MPNVRHDANGLSEQEIQIRQRSLAFVGIGVPTLSYFGIVAIREHDYLLAGLALGTALIVAICTPLLWYGLKSYRAIRPSVVSYTILVLYMVAYSGPEHARGLWFLSLPLISIMLLPLREGATWTAGAITTAAVLMIQAENDNMSSAYSNAYIARYIITAVLIGGVVLWSEIILRRYQIRLEGQNAALAAERDHLEREIVQRTALEQELRFLATTDPLTGLLNRRAFTAGLHGEIVRNKRQGRQFTLLMLDIDHFKQINDTYGHPAGDAVLVHLSGLLTQQLRNIDKLARVGGEEFAILLTDTPPEASATVIERLLTTIRSQPAQLPADAGKVAFTVSIGCTGSRPEDDEQTAIARADKALYAAKQGGRDRHCWSA